MGRLESLSRALAHNGQNLYRGSDHLWRRLAVFHLHALARDSGNFLCPETNSTSSER
jgi:hypothetical protein